MVKFKKRLLAYVIDFLIFFSAMLLIETMLPKSEELNNLNNQLLEIEDSYINQKITAEEYINEYQQIIILYDKENIGLNICSLILILGIYIIIPFYNNGQTLGKKIIKIGIVKNNGNLTIRDMILRNFITTSLLQLMLSSMFVYILPSNIYFIIISIIGFIQILLVILTLFMILYRKDKKGIQDLITGTSVIEVEK
ncbi:MAG: RDD family protein [Bacilli bacterium]